MADDGHCYSFGAPAGGWPDFGEDGRREPDNDQPLAGAVVFVPYAPPYAPCLTCPDWFPWHSVFDGPEAHHTC